MRFTAALLALAASPLVSAAPAPIAAPEPQSAHQTSITLPNGKVCKPRPSSAVSAPASTPTGGADSGRKIRNIQVGPRPYYLVDSLREGELKTQLESCSENPFETTSFAISHRGAPLQFPEHSVEGVYAAARQGAGIIECDVAFTSDRQLVCRHAQCDLHYTTDILSRPELAEKCSTPFTPADPDTDTPAEANCCTSDITLEEFESLCAVMEGGSPFDATNVSATDYFGRVSTTPRWRTDLYAHECARVMSVDSFIDIVEDLGLNFTAEAKEPEVEMPFQGEYTQDQYVQQLADAFTNKGIAPERVWLQSFLLRDVLYWVDNTPEFGRRAVYLDERPDSGAEALANATAGLADLYERGVRIVAPAIYVLVNTTDDGEGARIVPSEYAIAAREAGLEIITWSFERTAPPIFEGSPYYYSSVTAALETEGDQYAVMDVIAREVGATGVFVDWPGTATYYGNCFGLKGPQ